MVREYLRRSKVSICDLANYFRVSRPTMYKYIESYERQDFDEIPKKELQLFKYLEEHPNIKKENLISYIFSELIDVLPIEINSKLKALNDTKLIVKKYGLFSNEVKLIGFMASDESLHKAVSFLADVSELLNKKEKTYKEEEILNIYKKLLVDLNLINDGE